MSFWDKVKRFFRKLKFWDKEPQVSEDGRPADKIITFKRENRVLEVITVGVIGLLLAFGVFMSVLYITKVPIKTKPEEIIFDSEYITSSSDGHMMRIPTGGMRYITYRILPATATNTSVAVFPDNSAIARGFQDNGQIRIYGEAPGTTILTIYASDRSVRLRLTVEVYDLISTGMNLNYENFFTNSDERSGIMGRNSMRVLEAVLDAKNGGVTGTPSKDGVNYTLSVLESDRKTADGKLVSPVSIVPESSLDKAFRLSAGDFSGKVRITLTPKDGGDYAPLEFDLSVVLYPENIRFFHTPSDTPVNRDVEGALGDAVGDKEELTLHASLSEGPVRYDIKEYTDLNFSSDISPSGQFTWPGRTEVFGYFDGDKGLSYSLSGAPEGVTLTKDGVLTVDPLEPGVSSLKFSVVASSKYSPFLSKGVNISVNMPVLSMDYGSIYGFSNTIDLPHRFSAPLVFRRTSSYVDERSYALAQFDFNAGIEGVYEPAAPENKNLYVRVFETYDPDAESPEPVDLENDILGVLPREGQLVFRLSPTNFGSAVYHIGVFAADIFSHREAGGVKYQEVRGEAGFCELWIHVINERPLTGVTFVPGDVPRDPQKSITVPEGTDVNLLAYLYPVPSDAHTAGQVSFVLSNNGEPGAEIDAATGVLTGLREGETAAVEVRLASDWNERLASFEVSCVEGLDFRWKDREDGQVIRALTAEYSSSEQLEAFLNEKLVLPEFLSELHGIAEFTVEGADGAITISDELRFVVNESFSVGEEETKLLVSVLIKDEFPADGEPEDRELWEFLNFENEKTGSRAYGGVRDMSLQVFIV